MVEQISCKDKAEGSSPSASSNSIFAIGRYGLVNFTQRSINFPLIEVSKREKDWLIKNNYLKLKKGRYADLTVTSRKKSKSKRKKYYVPEPIYKKLGVSQR